MKDDIVKSRGIQVGQLFKMVIRMVSENPCKKEVNLSLIRCRFRMRFGHQNKRHVQRFLARAGIEAKNYEEFCSVPVPVLRENSIFKLRQQRAIEPGELIHADLCEPMECKSLGAVRYFVYFTCDYTRYRMVYFLKKKIRDHR